MCGVYVWRHAAVPLFGEVSASAIVHCVRGVRMTVRFATLAHYSLTYLAAKYVADDWRMAYPI